MHTLIFMNAGEQVTRLSPAPSGSSLLEIAMENDVDVMSLCGGKGSCKSCHICILQGSEFLHYDDVDITELVAGEKWLACQTFLKEDIAGTVIVEIASAD